MRQPAEREDKESSPWILFHQILTALCLDAESVFEAFVRVGTGDNLGVGAAHVHISLSMDDVAAIALQPVYCSTHAHKVSCNVLLLWK